jgi:hypothetical protein
MRAGRHATRQQRSGGIVITIEEMPGSEFVTIKLSGVVTRADVDEAIPRLELIFEERMPLRLYVELVGLDRFETSGLWRELQFHSAHGDKIARAAFVVGSSGEEWSAWVAEQMTEGATRRFARGEEDEARAWLLQA